MVNMALDVEMNLDRADHFEPLAATAPSNVLRCRYMSMARYWSILSSDRSSIPLVPSHGEDGGDPVA